VSFRGDYYMFMQYYILQIEKKLQTHQHNKSKYVPILKPIFFDTYYFFKKTNLLLL